MNKINNFRPQTLKDFFGQENIINELKVYIYSAKKRKTMLNHILLIGSAGLGKTTLANIISKELNRRIKVITASMIETTQDLIEILALIEEGDVLFIDEIHRLDKKVEEVLYGSMEDFMINIPYKSEEKTKIIDIELPNFTLIGATTLEGLISLPLRERFPIKFYFSNYSNDEISKIINKNAKDLKLNFTSKDCLNIFSSRCRNNPRIANGLLNRLYDYSIYKNISDINEEFLFDFFKFIRIDSYGLNDFDRKFLLTIYEKFKDQAVSLESIASILNENILNIKETTEPYLVSLGFINRTRRGRVLTELGKKYIKSL